MHQHPEMRKAVLQSTSLKRVVILRRKQKQTFIFWDKLPRLSLSRKSGSGFRLV